jgi:hypothetical protein
MSKLVIQVKYGGLGDHLFFSHIPRIAKQNGVGQVLISNRSEYRDPVYKSFIWANNPYVDGFIDEQGMDFKELERKVLDLKGDMNLLDRNMIALGLDDGERWHEPELHLRYMATDFDAVEKSLYDGNYVSNVGTFRKNPPKTDLQIFFDKGYKRISNESEDLRPNGLSDYCNMILSCKKYSCVTSGQATLAAALGIPAICYYGEGQNPIFHHSKLHKYIKL